MKKVQKIVILVLCVALGLFAFAACGGNDDKDKVTVTFYDATGTTVPAEMKVLKTEKVKKGSTVASYSPTKDGGYEFINWFATPSKSHVFDFTAAIDKDTSIYGGFSKYVADTRDFYILGAGTSEILLDGWSVANTDAAWDAVKDAHKFTKSSATDKNEYTLTLDLIEGDQFVIASNRSYHAKRGYGYLDKLTLDDTDKTEVFTGQGSVYDDSSKGSNIKVSHSGNYTLTLTTHPGDDYYNTSAPTYTEEGKEVYNLNPYDKIGWVRNGDPEKVISTTTAFYIKGEKITAWGDMFNDATKMTKSGDVHTLSVYLAEGDQFMFTSRVTDTATGNESTGSVYLKSNLLDTEGQALVGGYSETGGNMTAKASGTYTFTYNETTQKFTVAFDASKTPDEYDYYLDRAADNKGWGDYFTAAAERKFTKDGGVYKLENVQFAKDDEFVLRAHEAGATTLEWSNVKFAYNWTYLSGAGDNFVKPDGGTNIKVATAGNYDITFDSYSKIIKIAEHSDSADVFDIYIKGVGITNSADTASTWDHGFAAEWKFTINADETAYEFTATFAAGDSNGFGLAKYDKGASTGFGDYIGATAMGSDGDANSSFTPASGTNFACPSGTYKVVYTIATGKVDFYSVNA